MTARSEHQVDGAPFFVYDSIWANGFAWSTLDPSDVYRPERAAIAAIGMRALWETPYTDLLMEAVGDLSTEDSGFYEGLYENGNGYIPLQTANNNGIILASLLYKEQGPILKKLNGNTQVWDTAFTHQDTRAKRCLPQPKPAQDCCNCQAVPAAEAGVSAVDFLYCHPVVQADGSIAATACGLEPHGLPRLHLTLAADDPFFAGNAAVHLALNDAGIRHRFTVSEGRHDWVFWRQALPEALRHAGAVMTRQYGE